MTQLTQSLRLDLTNTLTRYMELLANLLESAAAAIIQTKAQLQHLALAFGQAVKHILHLLLKQLVAGRISRSERCVILNEITQVAIIFLANRRLQAHRLLADLNDLTHLLRANLHLLRDLLRCWFATEVLQQTTADTNQTIDRLNHMYRNTNSARLVSNRTCNRLANPPGS